MSRQEEIEYAWFVKSVQSNHKYDERTFKEAVAWADKTMINKACALLSRIIAFDVGFVAPKDIIDNFSKAMEE